MTGTWAMSTGLDNLADRSRLAGPAGRCIAAATS
jgi:hypothetical protein